MAASSRNRLIAGVVVLLLASLLVLQACSREESPSGNAVLSAPKESVADTRVVGLPAAQGAAGVATELQPEPTVAPPAPPPILQPGEELAGLQEVTLYASTASSSTVMEAYPAGTLFTVLEPTDEFGVYPVNVGGASWARVRAADGLAGWVKSADLGR